MDEKVFSIKPSNKFVMYNIFKDLSVFIIITILLMVLKNFIENYITLPFNVFGIITTIAFIIMIINVIVTYIKASTTYYTLYPKNFVYQKGFFSIHRENLETYRIVDISSSQPFIYRFFGIGNVILHTIDRSDPILILEGIDDYLTIEAKVKEFAAKKRPTVIESYGTTVPGSDTVLNTDQAPSITDNK